MAHRLSTALFVGTWLPYSEVFIYDQVRHQQQCAITVFARSFSRHARFFPYERVVTLPTPEMAAYWAVRRSPTFTRALKENDIRLIHAHFGTNGVIAGAFARRLDLPLVVTFHGHDISGLLPQNQHSLRHARYRRHAIEMFDQAAMVLCASEELAEILTDDLGVPARKVRVHRLGIDLEMFSPGEIINREETPVQVLMVGRLVEKKGMQYGLEAFAQVKQEHPHIRLRVVGNGALREELENRAQALGLNGNVIFTGVQDIEGVRDEMRAADMIMAPSLVAKNGDRESGLMVLKEAGACGLPALSTQHGGIPEIVVDGETGFLVPERNATRLAGRLKTLVASPQLRRKMGQNARNRMENMYDTCRQNQRLESLLASVV